MSGKRILDAIAVLRASRNVAYNHFAIRVRQAELYTKTSSLTKALQRQNPTAFAAASQAFSHAVPRNAGDSIPQASDSTGEQVKAREQPGIQQDHHYTRSESNTITDKPADGAIHVEQAQAQRHPLPDGTIPPSDSDIGRDHGDVESMNKRPSTEAAKTPLEKSGNTFSPASSSQSSIPTPTGSALSSDEARIAQRRSEDQIPARSAEPPGDQPEFSIDQEKDVYYQPPGQAKPVLSSLPRVRVPKTENDVQGGDSHVPEDINADVYYSGDKEADAPGLTEEQLAQLFHSPRSKHLVGKKEKYLPGGKREFHASACARQRSSEAEKQELKQLGKNMASELQDLEVSLSFRLRDSS